MRTADVPSLAALGGDPAADYLLIGWGHRAFGRWSWKWTPHTAEAESGEGSGHFYATLLNDAHLNPVPARLGKVREGQSVGGYEWSKSAGRYLAPVHRLAPWLAAAEGLAPSGGEATAGGTEGFSAPAGRA